MGIRMRECRCGTGREIPVHNLDYIWSRERIIEQVQKGAKLEGVYKVVILPCADLHQACEPLIRAMAVLLMHMFEVEMKRGWMEV